LLFICCSLLPAGCKHEKPAAKTPRRVFSTYRSSTKGEAPDIKKEIFYGLLTPTEITTIFSRLGVPHDNSILNPVTNSDLYTSNAKAAINLGIYGVDFGYVKIFGIGQQMIDYILTVKEISNKLRIPEKYLIEPIRKLKSGMSDPDSVMALVNKSYSDIENHLRKDGRESTAGLMLMGGWIEALYITSQLLYNPENPDKEVVEKIAQQKYTLTSLIGFMRNYYDDPVVVFYTKKLIYLRRFYDTFNIYFKKGDLEIDTNRKVLLSSGSDINITIETLSKIKDYVNKLRTEIVIP
ncbi:MAG: hypothetical protein ACUVTX_09015, partial [Bacteroidales bacterium]